MKKKFKAIFTLGLSLISGILYRLGGTKKGTKWRDFGVPFFALLLLFILGGKASWWIWFLIFGAMFGVMTTYFKFGNQKNVKWYNWLIVGFMFGISALPYAWHNGVWLGFGIRTAILTITVPTWSEAIKDVRWEEGGRGVLFVVTIPLLLI